ncbi:Cytosolic iron-sulfur protein assembly protein [Hypoxylon texense]
MDNNIKLDTLNGSPLPRSRIPLSNRSNSNPPHYIPVRSRWDRKDSSEGQPSSHESIYDAPWVSDASSGAKSSSPPYLTPTIPIATTSTSTTLTTARPVTPPPSATSTRPVPDPNAESPLSRLEAETPFLYGHGTELAPILEQRSVSTLRTTGCNPSASDISSLLKHKKSATGSGNSRLNGNGNNNSNSNSTQQQQQPPRSLRRQNSFSLDDLSSCSLVHHDGSGRSSGKRRETSDPGGAVGVSTSFAAADGMSSGSSTRGSETGSNTIGIPRLRNTSKRHSPPVVETVDIHAYPQKPAYPPHQSPSTPTGFAEWLTHHRGRDTYPYPNPTATAQGAEHSFQEPTFRGVRSGHGNLNVHPYMERLLTGTHPGSMPEDGGSSAQGQGTAGGGQSVRGTQGSDACMESFAPAQHQSVYQQQRNYPWTCAACGRPANQRWSLLATVTGQGRGARRGNDWCSRCAWRKMVYLWCCCEQAGV